MSEFSSIDRQHMRRALELAANGLNTTTPNPSVGCVIADGENVIAESWHERAGEGHAEARALALAGTRAAGTTVYVTLEPCTVHGRTPPCVDALIAAGVGEVVCAMGDPNPDVNGQGYERLRAAGIAVRHGLFADIAAGQNEGYISRQSRGRPFVTLKWAQSLDGATAMRGGESQWITGDAAREDAHRLRARACAILTGIGTVLADDPSMTARLPGVVRQPRRVVVDSQQRIPKHARVLTSDADVLMVSPLACDNWRLGDGVECWQSPASEDGRVDLGALLDHLGALGTNELMVEAGATLTGALMASGLVDRIVAYVAPTVLGSETQGVALTPSWTTLSNGVRLTIENVVTVGRDLRVQLVPESETD
ncbi:MAG: bifunctional diaminohydroxyphosphoribosylaminopyrimidine deaminase/5-amino-6-(5-phosphoribosylamino)uracil reductase RibD [Pseudomonadota bacterium]